MRDHCGVMIIDGMRLAVDRRLQQRLENFKLPFGLYLDELARSERERDHVADLLTTNETYFFREQYQLDTFKNQVLPTLARDNATRKRLSIWSAGCSSGEEVYTLAMLVDETRLFQDWSVRLLGSDISRSVISQAREAVYGRSSFRTMPKQYEKYFLRSDDETRQVKPEITERCTFALHNLLKPDATAMVGLLDVIFCRNVLIYFDAPAKTQVLKVLYDHLTPGGYLFLGHSESLLNIDTPLETVRHENDIFYRRPR